MSNRIMFPNTKFSLQQFQIWKEEVEVACGKNEPESDAQYHPIDFSIFDTITLNKITAINQSINQLLYVFYRLVKVVPVVLFSVHP